jgi:putative restriction endonuclease
VPDIPGTDGWAALTDENILDRFAKIKIWKRGSVRAPHKPLLLLYALAALQRGEERLIPFPNIERDLGRLLEDFGPPRATRPEYPFWHLQSDGLWEIPERDALQADLDEASNRHNPRLTVIREIGAHGGLSTDLYEHLRAQPQLVNRIVQHLLDAHWEPTYHDDILNAIGMPWVTISRAVRRDPAFRDTILRIYEHRCAVCGYDGQLERTDLGIEAAHIRWHAAGGPDTPDNGLALCSFHHKTFDRGAIGLDDNRRILISQHVRGSHGVDELLFRFIGQTLRPPQCGEPEPALQNITWHRREVFRAPARLMEAQ